MKIELPLETWTNVFGFVPRSQLAKLLPHIGEEKRRKRTRQGRKCWSIIEDRQFISAVQFYLHKCGQITLDELAISKNEDGDEPMFVNNAEMKVPLEEVPPISQNIQSFQKISISSNDESVFLFLEQFYHKSLFTDVNLDLYCEGDRELNALILFLPKFLPLLTSIESIELDDKNIMDYFGKENFGRKMLASARVLLISDNFDFGNWCRRWLQTPREDNKPRVLIASNEHMRTAARFTSFVKNIRKDFLEANGQAVSFFVKVYSPSPWLHVTRNVQSESVDNNMTQEKLVINLGEGDDTFVTISRYPMKATMEWIEEMEQSVEDMEEEWNYGDGDENRKIELNFRI